MIKGGTILSRKGAETTNSQMTAASDLRTSAMGDSSTTVVVQTVGQIFQKCSGSERSKPIVGIHLKPLEILEVHDQCAALAAYK